MASEWNGSSSDRHSTLQKIPSQVVLNVFSEHVFSIQMMVQSAADIWATLALKWW